MKYLLDTNICIYLINKKPPSLIKKIMSFSPEDLGLSVITVAELHYGVEKSQSAELNHRALSDFLMPFTLHAYDDGVARIYGRIRACLEKKGQVIGSLDMLIAAHALSLQCTLVTNNIREFKRVPGLKVINWLKT